VIPWLFACVEAPLEDSVLETEADTDADADTDTDTDADSDSDTDTDAGLHGQAVDLAPPSFSVLNSEGQVRDEGWLLGHPSVLWFFRDTGST
jgi:hypothetical protein